MPGLPHHITQRGNLGATIFEQNADRLFYLGILGKYCERYGVDVLAYCLMTNHVHLVAVPSCEEALPMTIRDAHTRYAVWFNRRRGETGHLWQGRYYSCVMDESHMWSAVRYVECNPLRAGLVARAEEYRWSSAAAHCGLRADSLVSNPFPFANAVRDWSAWLAEEDVRQSAAIRDGTLKGRPVGSGRLLQTIETKMNIVLSRRRRGRPSNWQKQSHQA